MFELPVNTLRVPLIDTADVTYNFPKPVARIRKIIALGPDGPYYHVGKGYGLEKYGTEEPYGGVIPTASDRIVFFRHASVTSREFVYAELRPAGDYGQIVYDLVFPYGDPTLAMAPALSAPLRCVITSIYNVPRFGSLIPDDPGSVVVEPIIAHYCEFVVDLAVERFLRSVNDSDADRWGADAMQKRSAIMQDLGTRVEQHGEGVGTDLDYGDLDAGF
jgi:hypothetical protein